MEKAIFASGCFWGTQFYFEKEEGVISTTVGYTGGTKENPTYAEVCSHTTGHAEAVLVEFNPEIISYRELAKLFFETHNFTQINGQGPDIGEQYRSEVFYFSEEQKATIEELIKMLKEKQYFVATKLTKATKFWTAEEKHQNYYEKTGGTPYCHIKRRIF